MPKVALAWVPLPPRPHRRGLTIEVCKMYYLVMRIRTRFQNSINPALQIKLHEVRFQMSSDFGCRINPDGACCWQNDVRVRMPKAAAGAGKMWCWSLQALAKFELEPNHKLHHGTRIAKDCKLAPANPFMPRLNYFIFISGGRGCEPD